MAGRHLVERVIVIRLRITRIDGYSALEIPPRLVPIPVAPKQHTRQRIVRLGVLLVGLERSLRIASSLGETILGLVDSGHRQSYIDDRLFSQSVGECGV